MISFDDLRNILVTDASVLINFLRVGRMDLFGAFPADFLVTDHVAEEIVEFYPDQRARFEEAIGSGIITQVTLVEDTEIELFGRLSEFGRLGSGECSAIALAVSRRCALAIDDRRAIAEVRRSHKEVLILQTIDLVVAMVQMNLLTIAQADALKDEWAANHRFRLSIASFAEIMSKRK